MKTVAVDISTYQEQIIIIFEKENNKTKMDCPDSKHIFNNKKIVLYILKNLNLKDQLKMAKISKRFEYILIYILWPQTQSTIIMHKIPDAMIFSENVKDQVKAKKIALNDQESREFLLLNKDNIESLNFASKYEYYVKNKSILFENIQIFQNLIQLRYKNIIVKEKQLKILAKECKKLVKLELIECYNENCDPLMPGTNFKLENLYEIIQLEDLIIETVKNKYLKIKSYYVQEILTNLNLKKLILKNFYIEESELDLVKTVNKSLEILDIGIIGEKFWLKFLYILKHLSNIKELYIKVNDCNLCINDYVLDIMLKFTQLEKLSLENCDLYIKDFSVLKNLKHLELLSCGALTFDNFQQLLAGLTLKTFTLKKTRILGKLYYFHNSCSLELLTIDSIHFSEISNAFSMSLNAYENLHTINWLNGIIKDNWIIEKCPILRSLTIPSLYLQRSLVFSKKSLKELTFASCSCLNWDFIFILLKHLSLESLYFQSHDIISDEDIRCNCGLKTTLQIITLPCNIFRMAQSFWLELLFCNETLNITLYGKDEDILDQAFLYNLLNNIRFCQRIKKLQICGFELGKYTLVQFYYSFNTILLQLY